MSRTMGGREADASDTLRGLSEAVAKRAHPGRAGGGRLAMPVFTYVDSGHRAGPTLTADATTETHTLNVITREHGVLTESETVHNLKMVAGASSAACWITISWILILRDP